MFTGLHDEIDQSAQFVESQTTELTQQVQQIETFIVSDCMGKIDAKVDEFSSRMTDAATEMTQHLEKVADDADSKSDEILSEAKEHHESFINDADGVASDTEGDLKQAHEKLGQVIETFATARDELSQGIKLTNTGFDTAVSALKEIQKILDRFWKSNDALGNHCYLPGPRSI